MPRGAAKAADRQSCQVWVVETLRLTCRLSPSSGVSKFRPFKLGRGVHRWPRRNSFFTHPPHRCPLADDAGFYHEPSVEGSDPEAGNQTGWNGPTADINRNPTDTDRRRRASPRPSSARRRRLPAGSRPCRTGACASCPLSACRGACACGWRRRHSILPSRLSAGRRWFRGR